jgi:hypothetical protein
MAAPTAWTQFPNTKTKTQSVFERGNDYLDWFSSVLLSKFQKVLPEKSSNSLADLFPRVD